MRDKHELIWVYTGEKAVITYSLMCVLGGREGFLMLSYHSVTISISININREEMSKTEKGRNYH